MKLNSQSTQVNLSNPQSRRPNEPGPLFFFSFLRLKKDFDNLKWLESRAANLKS